MKKLILLILICLMVITTACQKEQNTQKKVIQGEPRDYKITDSDKCTQENLNCPDGETAFFDENGCGCIESDNKLVRHYCSLSDRKERCNDEADSVCGWFGKGVLCFSGPCNKEYANSCKACLDSNIAYWTEGQCS